MYLSALQVGIFFVFRLVDRLNQQTYFTMKNIKTTLVLSSLLLTSMLSSCSRQTGTDNKKVQTTENKTEGYLYHQNDHNMKGDSTTVKKSVNN
ncbi:hypothetical protein L0657_04335 [Dyadobacter sp. CY345]|uniref:hypothetical protein n=1 Tax=Dyadobacter sp. CY345 TaxID=2909335 RepID=UPI001F3850E6|nr:hypothetical protein [Dyadobacter sp. CY345]MCF2443176.1 hypothetical protein [Dyadobacter sp. CY345]